MTDYLTPDGISAEYGIPTGTIRHHCRDPRSELYGVAQLIAGRWIIPTDAARAWAQTYQRYQRKAAPGGTETPGAAAPSTDKEERANES